MNMYLMLDGENLVSLQRQEGEIKLRIPFEKCGLPGFEVILDVSPYALMESFGKADSN